MTHLVAMRLPKNPHGPPRRTICCATDARIALPAGNRSHLWKSEFTFSTWAHNADGGQHATCYTSNLKAQLLQRMH